MGLLDFWRRTVARSDAIAPNGVPVEYEFHGDMRGLVNGLSPEELFRVQPHLRTVVSFLGRNVAQLGLKTYDRVSDTDRKRVTSGTAHELLGKPNPDTTGYELLNSLVSSLALYDEAYWWVRETSDGWRIDNIPVLWIHEKQGGGIFSGPKTYVLRTPDGKHNAEVPADQILHFHEWTPETNTEGVTRVDALKSTLKEQISAAGFREQMWARGGRAGATINRPIDAPPWSEEASQRFKRDWAAHWTGSGAEAGGTPILGDGMTLQQVRFSAKEEEWLEAAKLSLATVAQVFHVNPTMVGQTDDANYSNVKEFHKRLYTDTLGPTLAMIEDRLNTFLLPMLGEPDDRYLEFNVEAKLKGSFEEQAAAFMSATGGPWMLRSEARAMQNLPEIEGADELIVPMNVSDGDQAAPNDSGSQNVDPNAESHDDEPKIFVGVQTKASPAVIKAIADLLRKFFRRQQPSVLGKLANGEDDWWDEERWNRELATDLYRLSTGLVAEQATSTLNELGESPWMYNPKRTDAFLKAVSETRARWINNGTRKALLQAIDDEIDLAEVFNDAIDTRTDRDAKTMATTFTSIGTAEGAKSLEDEVGEDNVFKVWVHNPSEDPRHNHELMDGEKVGVDERFSNNAMWPGDPILGPQGTINCGCDIEVEVLI